MHAMPAMVVMVLTRGSQVEADLLAVPGTSRTALEAIFPPKPCCLEKYLIARSRRKPLLVFNWRSLRHMSLREQPIVAVLAQHSAHHHFHLPFALVEIGGAEYLAHDACRHFRLNRK